MTELHRLQLRFGEVLACELLAVVRDHHVNMPGASRDRPGSDRVRVRLPASHGGAEVVIDVWSRSGQDIARAPQAITVYDNGDLIGWRAAEAAELPATPSLPPRDPSSSRAHANDPANDP